MNYYNEIKNKIIDNEIYGRIKDYSKERNRVITYFEIGKLLNEAGSKYGDNIIGEYSKRLTNEVGKKYNCITLFRMKQLYSVFSNEKESPLVTQLTWSHCLILMALKDINEIYYYAKQVILRNLSKRELESIIKSDEYERLNDEAKEGFIKNEENNLVVLIKNPILIKNGYNYVKISEKILQTLILEDIESFMKELGNSFCFIGSEYKIKIGNNFNYIDLLLFNIKFNCYVVVELKTVKLKKEHIGQIEIYMNYVDKNLKRITHGKTIGIIICKQNDKFIIKYCSDSRIIAREYELF